MSPIFMQKYIPIVQPLAPCRSFSVGCCAVTGAVPRASPYGLYSLLYKFKKISQPKLFPIGKLLKKRYVSLTSCVRLRCNLVVSLAIYQAIIVAFCPRVSCMRLGALFLLCSEFQPVHHQERTVPS